MNYTGGRRSNRFAVKNADLFLADMARIPEIDVSDQTGDGQASNSQRRFCLFAEEPGGGWPSQWLRETPSADHHETEDWDAEAYEDLDLVGLIASHLSAGEVAVLIETGNEGLRYLVGSAVAVNDTGETRAVNLNDIYSLAADLGGDNVAVAEH